MAIFATRVALLLVVAVLRQAQLASAYYPIQLRGATTRNLQIDEDAISFDGDVDYIKALALTKALSLGGSGETNSGTADPFACPGAESEYMEVLTWVFSLEYDAEANITSILPELEKTLQIALAPRLLSCINPDAEAAGIVAERSMPADTLVVNATCPIKTDSANACHVVEGQMRLFLTTENSLPQAVYLAQTYLKALMDAEDSTVPAANLLAKTVGHGLVKATYLGPDIVNPNATSSREPSASVTQSSADMGNTSIAFITVGSAALLVFVGSIYFWRSRRGHGSSHDMAASQAAGTSLNESSAASARRRRQPTSPFSEMLPSAYRFNENMSVLSAPDSGLSAVMEASDDENLSSTAAGGASIVMSESGYTTDAAGDEEDNQFEYPKLLYTTHKASPTILGARKRHENALTLGSEPDHFSETSSEAAEDGIDAHHGLMLGSPSELGSNDADDEASDMHNYSTQSPPDLLMDNSNLTGPATPSSQGLRNDNDLMNFHVNRRSSKATTDEQQQPLLLPTPPSALLHDDSMAEEGNLLFL